MANGRTLFRLLLSLGVAVAITAEDRKRRKVEEVKVAVDNSGKDIIVIEIEV